MVYGRKFKAVPLVAGIQQRKRRTYAARPQKAMVVRGFTRVGGNYGRFGASRGRRASLGGELKYFDTSLAATNVPQVGVVNPNLVIVPQGDAENNRIGRKINIRSIWLKGTIFLNVSATAAAATDTVRMILVQDKQANGAVFTVADVLQNTDYIGFRNLANTSRFNILWDKTYNMSAMAVFTATPAGLPTEKALNMYVKCNIPIEYDAALTTGVITTQRSNSLAVLMISENNNVSQVEYRCRIRYSDN